MQADYSARMPDDSDKVPKVLSPIIAARFAEAVDKTGLKQEEIADRTGYHQTTISGWKNGRAHATLDMQAQVMEKLGLNPLILIGAVGPDSLTSEELDLVERFRLLSAADRGYILGWVAARTERARRLDDLP